MWRRRLRYQVLKFLRLKESPRSVALGFALGACSNFLPFVGFGGLAVAFIAGLLRINIPASLLGHFLFAPIFPFFFSLNVFVGRLLLKTQVTGFENSATPNFGLSLYSFSGIGKAFIIGAGIDFLVFGFIIFILSYKVFVTYRKSLALWFFLRRRPRLIKDKPPKDGKPPKK